MVRRSKVALGVSLALVERGSGKIARASAVLDAWDGDESRVRAKFAKIAAQDAEKMKRLVR